MEHKKASSVSLVTVAFRDLAGAERLVESVRSSTLMPVDAVIVHNSVAPRSGAAPAGAYDGLRTEVVLGDFGPNVSAARNAGWHAARGDAVFFVDDDNTLEPETLERLIDGLYTSGAAAAAPVAYLGNSSTIWCAGVTRSRWTGRTHFMTSVVGRGTRAFWPTDDLPNAFCVTRSALEQVGGFDDEHFPMHREEADLTMRLRAAGYGAVVVREATVRHHTEMITRPADEVMRVLARGGSARLTLWVRGRVAFHRRHSHGLERAAALVVFIPAWALVVLFGVARMPIPLVERFRVATIIVRALWAGYRMRIDQRAHTR
jgi:GT2 family glycosyltransferase